MKQTITPEFAQQRLTQYINTGYERGVAAVQEIEAEFRSRRDYILPPSVMRLAPNGHNITIGFSVPATAGGQEFSPVMLQTTDHAHNQILSRLRYPTRYYDDLAEQGEWARELIAHDLKVLSEHHKGKMLVRAVQGVAKGVLSDSYARFDASPIIGQYLMAADKHGWVLTDGNVTETRLYLRHINPEIVRIANDYVVFGTELRSSDYGAGRLLLSFFLLRVVCANGAVGTDMFSKVHLGKRFEDDSLLSERTRTLDTRTVGSAIRDVIGSGKWLEEANRVRALIEGGTGEINHESILDRIQKRGRITKGEMEQASTLYETVDVVEQLPEQAGTWRLSNVLSMMANKAEGDRRLELQITANEILSATRN